MWLTERYPKIKRSRVYGLIMVWFRTVLRWYFGRVEVVGLESLPTKKGGILVAWHPNGMVDGGLIYSACPHHIIVGAAQGVFRWPILGRVMRLLGSVPIYRGRDSRSLDPEKRFRANMHSLDAMAGKVATGFYSLLFPEGHSHDAPHLHKLKTGSARFYYRARQLQGPGTEPPAIIPVVLQYEKKREYGANVLIRFMPPIELTPDLDHTPSEDEPFEQTRARCRQLTAEIEQRLTEGIRATETWEQHYQMHRVRKLMRAEQALRDAVVPGPPTMVERDLGFARVRRAYQQLGQDRAEALSAVQERVQAYDEHLKLLGLEDHELDRSPREASIPRLGLLIAQIILVYLLLPPLLIIGYTVNLPMILALWVGSKIASKSHKDEASIKAMFSTFLLPLGWLTAGLLTGLGYVQLHRVFPIMPDAPVLAGLLTTALCVLGGMAALRYWRLVRNTAHAIRVRITRNTRRKALTALRAERVALYDKLVELFSDLALPRGTGEAEPPRSANT
jgi:glycerol-3-phosphate O-acyltransferase / dihydroxyacetone phosphate acyltransferase